MPLLDFWKSRPDEFQSRTVQQIVVFAGDGKLRDDSATCAEFREFLDQVDSDSLIRYAEQCLEQPFPESGFVLQDIVNQIGKRLGFDVKFGRYRGVSNEVGHDGLWRASGGIALVTEVKTTSAYQISLDTSVSYRRKLIEQGSISELGSSILYVVGRSATSDFESQVRGSRHAWDIRLIGVDALARLLKLRESMDDPAILERVRSILRPNEYTRVDGIIDLVFTTTNEATKDEQFVIEEEIDETVKKFTPVNFREACFARLSKHVGTPLMKRSVAIHSSADGLLGVYCAMSRAHPNASGNGYWFGFHPGQRDALSLFEHAHVAFACGSEEQIILIPFSTFEPWLSTLNQTILEGRHYWHVKFEEANGVWTNVPKADFPRRDVTEFLLRE
ncbi:MAG: hypothetical protein ACO1TE_15065 [Prosthecobacter sp.]